MRSKTKLFGVIGVLALCQPARADPPDSPGAEALFRAGREASERGDLETACLRYEESYRLESAVGTLLNWAICNDDLGRLASAWEQYRRILELFDKKDPRIAMVRERLAKIESRVPYVTLSFEATTPPGSEARRDGVPVARASLGVPLPMNPGVHEVVVTAAGRKPARFTIKLEEGQRLELSMNAGPPVAPHASPRTDAAPARIGTVARGDSAQSTKTAGWIALGTGGVSLAAAGLLGWQYFEKRGVLEEHCPGNQCDPEGLEAVGALKVLEPTVAVTLSAGVIGIGAAILLLSLPQPRAKRARTPAAFVVTPTFMTAGCRF